MTLLVPLLHLLALFTAFACADLTRNPIVALRPRNLVAFYPLLLDSRDYAPNGTADGYTQDGYSHTTIIPKLGGRLEQGTGLDFPVNIHRRSFPHLTIGAWVQVGEAMAVNRGCLLSQTGSSVGRSVCVDRGKWTVGGQVLDVAVKFDEWSFVAVVFDENSTQFFVDGEIKEIDTVVGSVASPLLVVGAAANDPLTGFTGYVKSVFVFDSALSETELAYLMTTKEVKVEVIPVPTLVPDPVVKVQPKPHLYLKDRLENSVSARQVIDPDADEYNAALPVLDDTELLSVELVYADDIPTDEGNSVDFTPFNLWSLEPKLRDVHVGSKVTVQGSPSFDSLTSMCRINDDISFAPYKVTAHSIACQIPEMNVQAGNVTIKISISQDGVFFTSIGEFRLLQRPSIIRLSPLQTLRSVNPQVIDIFGMNFVNLSTLSCSIGDLTALTTFISSFRIQCAIESTRYYERLSSVQVDVTANGVDFSDDPKDLELINAPIIDRLSPDNGPTTGGTVVEISGHGFLENMRYAIYCGQNVTDDVEFMSPNLLIWRTTGANFTGIVGVKLKVEDKLVPEIPSLQFSFTLTPQITSIFPQLLPVRSEILLTISGSDFGDFAELRCSFKTLTSGGKALDSTSWTSIATFIASSIVQCPTPPFHDAGFYAVSVSNNAQDFSSISSLASITIHDEILLENASISSGPATGGTSVDITGKQFVRSTDVTCRFGQSRARGYFISDSVIRCISPAWSPVIVTEGISPVPIRVALNGLDFSSSSLSFQYYAPPVVDAISPVNVPVNTSVSLALNGKYLVSFGGIVCRIGTLLVTGTAKNGGRMIQCNRLHTSMDSGFVEISVSLNGGRDFTRTRINLLVHEPVALRGLDTPYVAKNVNSSITVRGQGFLKGDGTMCVYGEKLTTASVISSEILTCPLPSTIQSGRNYELRISLNNGTHLSNSSTHVYVYDLPTFDTISPQTEILHVKGAGFVLNDSFLLAIECIFGDYVRVAARVDNDSSLFCGIPEMELSGNTSKTVAVSFQVGGSIITTDFTYTYEPTLKFVAFDPGAVPGRMPLIFQNNWSHGYTLTPNFSFDTPMPSTDTPVLLLPVVLPEIYDVSPKLVEKGSRVNITIHGQNFKKNSTFCHFSSQQKPIPAVVKSHAVAVCAFDGSFVHPGSISLSLSLNRLRPSITAAAFFVLLDCPTITSIYPRRGPLDGNTTVHIAGTGFVDNQALYCHFDGLPKVLARRLTSTMVQCLTPPSRSGRDSVLRVSIDSSIYSSNSIQFVYQDMPQLASMSPSYGSVEGGTMVVLNGRWLNVSEDVVMCAFGSIRVDTQIGNSTNVIVASPPSAVGIGDVTVKCTLNGELITPAKFSFHYLLTPYLSRIAPQMGLVSSSTKILVDGIRFSEKYPMSCHFGNESSPAIVLSSFQLECIAPPYSLGIVNISVTLSGASVGNSSVAFEYIAEPKLQQLIPPLGSEGGSTRILIVGEKFTRHADMSCLFSRDDDPVVVTTAAFWISEGVIICHTPPFSPGLAYVQLALGENLASNRLPFNFTIEPQVFSVSPKRSSGAGNAIVTITGAGFVNSNVFRCKMGTTIVRPVKFESESRVICKFPRQIHSGFLPVRVSNNNQDFTTDPVLFTLYPPVVVDYVTPLYGLVDEEFTRVDLVGHNSHKMVDLVCQIIQDGVNLATTVAIFVSTSMLTCSLPTPTEFHSISNVSVAVPMTLQVKEISQEETIFEAPFRYLAASIPMAVFPTLLLVTGGQTVVIEAVNLVSGIDLVCQFESYYPYDQTSFVSWVTDALVCSNSNCSDTDINQKVKKWKRNGFYSRTEFL
ncbi:hypothetical protein L915_13920 [Phytophthora nicotianae]|uniref:IPT/TIG domain-containing protein n=1 Tax=Phytophthora nicotianae TaxID=4792 RepID=W2GBE9_PHYNI|nr:hypothetical protein L915_13920 [Phytophthora nicotianae]